MAVVGILLVAEWWIWKNQIVGICSDKTPQFCDKTCKSDEDCKLECGCGCISKKEKCICLGVGYVPPHPCFECKCINNTCISKGNKFYIDAKKTKNAFLCENIENQTCKDICYFELALETKNISLCEKIVDKERKRVCSMTVREPTKFNNTEVEIKGTLIFVKELNKSVDFGMGRLYDENGNFVFLEGLNNLSFYHLKNVLVKGRVLYKKFSLIPRIIVKEINIISEVSNKSLWLTSPCIYINNVASGKIKEDVLWTWVKLQPYRTKINSRVVTFTLLNWAWDDIDSDLHLYDNLQRHVGYKYPDYSAEVQIPNSTYNRIVLKFSNEEQEEITVIKSPGAQTFFPKIYAEILNKPPSWRSPHYQLMAEECLEIPACLSVVPQKIRSEYIKNSGSFLNFSIWISGAHLTPVGLLYPALNISLYPTNLTCDYGIASIKLDKTKIDYLLSNRTVHIRIGVKLPTNIIVPGKNVCKGKIVINWIDSLTGNKLQKSIPIELVGI